MRVDDDKGLFLTGLAEIELKRRSRIIGWRWSGFDSLRLVYMTQCDVVSIRGEYLCCRGPIFTKMNLAFRRAEASSV